VHGGGLRARVNQLTHQRTNVDGWCTDGCTFFVPPCPWANQGGELRLTFFSVPPSAQVGFFWELCFSHPSHPPESHLPTHPSAYLPPYPSTYLPLYLLTKFPPRRWWHMSMVYIAIYQVGCFVTLPTYLPLVATSQLLKAALQWPKSGYCNYIRWFHCSLIKVKNSIIVNTRMKVLQKQLIPLLNPH
jgi:hypothetical protein